MEIQPVNSPSASQPSAAALWRDFRRWAVRIGLSNKLALLVLILALVSGIATYIVLTAAAPPLGKNPKIVYWLLNFNVVILIVLAGMIIRRVITLWLGSRRGLAGARLHVQLVRAFSFIAIVPGIVMAIFAAILFSSVVDRWFGERVRLAIDESLAVAHAYLQEHQQNIRADVLAMAVDLNREAPNILSGSKNLDGILRTQSLIRNLTEALVFTSKGEILGRAGLTFSLEFETIPPEAMQRAREGEVALQVNMKGDRVRALIRLQDYPDAYLVVGRLVGQRVLNYIETAQNASDEYMALQGRRSQVQLTFAVTFVIVALLLTLVAVWVGLTFANRLAAPISRLIEAAEKVRAGDLTVRIQEMHPMDELATLQRAFNRMTSQLESKTQELMTVNASLDERRRFIEEVLSGISAGILAVNEEGRITVVNQSAHKLLEQDMLLGRALSDIIPDIEKMRLQLLSSDQKLLEAELQWGHSNEMNEPPRTFLVTMTKDWQAEQPQLVIIKIDDVITALQSAQRKAAWSDVARRIAHEIKNPLTPIQLSAERLKRRYLKQINDDPATFESCIDTIVRQVNDIERMVTEFSNFARLPDPLKKKEDLTALCLQAVQLQEQARSDLHFILSLPEEKLFIWADRQQISQMLTNLLQNAIDAIDGRDDQNEQGMIALSLETSGAHHIVVIEDNGKGLPENRDRLTEPYVTTRAKGTGLGLAIVKKILDDHDGILTLLDRKERQGARIEIRLPIWHNSF